MKNIIISKNFKMAQGFVELQEFLDSHKEYEVFKAVNIVDSYAKVFFILKDEVLNEITF